jgi:hypothetical protein
VTPRKLHTFYLDSELAEGLKAVKERDGVNEGEQVRRAVRAWLEQKGVLRAERKRAATRQRP